MLAYVLDAWAEVMADGGSGSPIVVYSPATAALLDAGLPGGAVFALQDEPRGTADAVRAGLAAVPDDVTELIVLSGDVPLVLGPQLRAILEQRRMDDAAIALASVFAAVPGHLGHSAQPVGDRPFTAQHLPAFVGMVLDPDDVLEQPPSHLGMVRAKPDFDHHTDIRLLTHPVMISIRS